MTTSLWSSYPGVPVIVETGLAGLGARAGVRVVSSGQDLGSLASLVTTEYVLLASDLDYVSNWTNIERGVSRAIELTVSMSSKDQVAGPGLAGRGGGGRGSEEQQRALAGGVQTGRAGTLQAGPQARLPAPAR